MIEKQVYNAYVKLKKRLKTTIDSDNFFEDFISILRSGKRQYFRHNVEVNKYIDEVWVAAIEKAIPHLEVIINNPRKFIESLAEVMPIELARKIGIQSIKHLAANTHFLSHVDDEGYVIPAKILSSYNEESIDIYENRFVMTLLNKVDHFIDIRYFVLGGTAGNEFASDFGMKGIFDQNDEKTTYSFNMKVEQGAKYLPSADDTIHIFERLERVRSYIREFKRSDFVRIMSQRPSVRMPINKTNLLMKSVEYSACFELWEFMDQYTKAGYTMEILESDPAVQGPFANEAELLLLCNYLLVKNYMAEYLETQSVKQKKRREVDPRIIEKSQIKLEDTHNITDYKTLLAAMKQGRTQRVSNAILQAITRALDTEENKKAAAEAELLAKEEKIADIIRLALGNETRKKQEAEARVMKTVKDAEVATAIVRTLEAAGLGHSDDDDDGERFYDAPEKKARAGSKGPPKPKAKKKILEEGILSFEDADDISAILQIMNKDALDEDKDFDGK